MRMAGAAAITLVLLWLLNQRLASLDMAEVMQAFSAVAPAQWILALAATALSFWAVGKYDDSLHRHLNTGTAAKDASRAGMAAIALSQTLGLGVLTGALVRWRMLPKASLLDTTKLSVAVTLSFLFGWSMVTALVLLILPAAPLKMAAMVAVALGGIATLLCLIQPRLTLLGRKVALPNIFTLWQILVFSFVDTGAAALALWLVCPADLALPFAALLPAYLLALGAGLLSGTPGGVGAFEMTLLAALPAVPEPGLIAGILTFRLVYYAVPAVLAAIAAVIAPNVAKPSTAPRTALHAHTHEHAPAEAGLAAQNHISIFDLNNKSQILMGKTSHFAVTLLDPFGPAHPTQVLRSLTAAAKTQSRLPALYKCGPHLAGAARQAGWRVAPVAAEAWLNPTSFTLDGPEKSALRRKLRKAEKAGILARELTRCDWPQLAKINREWSDDNGGERGFSMGRYAPNHIAQQRVFGAFLAGELCAFVSFHHNSQEWVLDLMRHRSNTPDGTNYALITLALNVAGQVGIQRFSLAAAPRLPDMGPLLRRWTIGLNGLCQFKASFAPTWQPLYIAAQNPVALLLAAAEIYREIHAPPPLSPASAHDHHAQNEIALRG
jgi:phosphatidylglycerol lysyltransferase